MSDPSRLLPDGVTLVRTTAVFDENSVPRGLLRAHRVADGVWGRLVVESGSLKLVLEDDGSVEPVGTGQAAVIPPGRPHHVDIEGPVRFVVEFHR